MQWQRLLKGIRRYFSGDTRPRRIVMLCFFAVFIVTTVLAGRQYWVSWHREINSRQYNLQLQAIAVDSGIDTLKEQLRFLRSTAERALLNERKNPERTNSELAPKMTQYSAKNDVWNLPVAPENAPILALGVTRLQTIPELQRDPAQLREDLQLAQLMSQLLPVQYQRGKNLANVLYLSTSGVVVAHPAIDADQVEPALLEIAASNLLQSSPTAQFGSSIAFIARVGRPISSGNRLQLGTPLLVNGKVRGAIVFDVPQQRLQAYMQETTSPGEIHVLLDQRGVLIGSNEQSFSTREEDWLKITLGNRPALTVSELFQRASGEFETESDYFLYRKLDRSGFMLIDKISKANLRWTVVSQFSTVFVWIWISLGLLMLMTLLIVDLLLKRQLALIAQLSELSLIDTLTQLANRRRLIADFATMTKRLRGEKPIALMMLDIDKFKAINDNWGHSAGDEVLKHLATLCRALVRTQDLVVRYGGEEFCVLLPGATLKEATSIAEKIRNAIANSVCLPDPRTLSRTAPSTEIRITVSIGVAELGGDGCDHLDHLVAKADGRLYLAKQNGRNRVICDDCLSLGPIPI
jgi:diguanylate cyclase (GGDEF)-like protein